MMDFDDQVIINVSKKCEIFNLNILFVLYSISHVAEMIIEKRTQFPEELIGAVTIALADDAFKTMVTNYQKEYNVPLSEFQKGLIIKDSNKHSKEIIVDSLKKLNNVELFQFISDNFQSEVVLQTQKIKHGLSFGSPN